MKVCLHNFLNMSSCSFTLHRKKIFNPNFISLCRNLDRCKDGKGKGWLLNPKGNCQQDQGKGSAEVTLVLSDVSETVQGWGRSSITAGVISDFPTNSGMELGSFVLSSVNDSALIQMYVLAKSPWSCCKWRLEFVLLHSTIFTDVHFWLFIADDFALLAGLLC